MKLSIYAHKIVTGQPNHFLLQSMHIPNHTRCKHTCVMRMSRLTRAQSSQTIFGGILLSYLPKFRML